MIALFFDTETTGLPHAGLQPEIVQLAAILQDTESKRVLQEVNLMVEPSTDIPLDVIKIHGITTAMANNYGVSQKFAEAFFVQLVLLADRVVAHNLEFDAEMVAMNWDGATAAMLQKDAYCTMRHATDIVKLPPGKYHQVDYSDHKPPKLIEAYKFFFNKPFADAHDAMADTRACRDVYFAIQKRKPS